MTKKIAKRDEADVPAVIDFSTDAGAGMENADKDSFAIPFLKVLQALSPEVADELVEGAKAGMLVNTITNELYTEAFVIPCSFQRKFLRFVPRDDGGGFKGDYSPIDIETGVIEGVERNDDGRLTIEGDELIDARNHFILVRTESGTWQPALMSLSSTQIKKSKRWMSLIQGIELGDANGRPYNPASFSHVYKVTTTREKNDKGTWHGLVIELDSTVKDMDLYMKAKAFHQSVASGEVKTQEPEQTPASKTTDNDRF